MNRLRVVVLETFGEFLREATRSVPKDENVTVTWAAAVSGCATLFLGVGSVLKPWSRS